MSSKFYKLFSYLLIGTFGMFLAASMNAQDVKPSAPINVAAKAIFTNQTTGNSAAIYWSVDKKSTTPTSFDIFQADTKSENTADFKKVATVKYLADNKEQNYTYTVENLTGAVYTFYVVANNEVNGMIYSSNRSAIAVVYFQNNTPTDYLNIFSDPKGDIKIPVGQSITVKLSYQTNKKDCKAIYTLYDYDKTAIDAVLNQDASTMTITGIKDAKFQLYVLGNLDCDKNIASKLVLNGVIGNGGTTVDPNKPMLSFDPQQMVVYATTGSPYTLILKPINKTNCALEFSILETSMKDLTIDAKTGTVIIPTVNANEKNFINIQAKTVCTEANAIQYKAVVYVTILTKEPEPKTTAQLYGKVVDQNGAAVPNGTVTAYPTDANGTAVKSRVYYSNINDGYYKSLPLTAGYYKIRFESKGYTSAYYDSPTINEFGQAKIVQVKDNDVLEINMAMNKMPEPKKFTVTGNVSDADGNPVFSYVELISLEMLTKGGVKGSTDNKGNLNGNGSIVTKTDEKGNFTIQLPEMGSFVAHAVSAMNSVQYQDQYFDNVTDPFQAEILYITDNRDGINFKLTKITNINNDKTTKGSITGNVTDGNGTIIKSTVTAIRIDGKDVKNQFKSIISVNTDDQGNYKIENIEVGQYILLSMPSAKNYAPGYYVENMPVSLKWKDATTITVISDLMMPPVVSRNIIHNLVKPKGGIGIVKGNVNSKGGVAGGGKVITVQGGAIAVSGAILTLVDANNNVVDYYFSDAKGDFQFNSLEEGTYRLVSDKAGYQAVETPIVMDFSKSAIVNTANIDLPIINAASVEPSVEFSSNVKVYPNPTANLITFTFNGTQGSANVKIYNESSELVYSNIFSAIDGENNFRLDLASVQSGRYILAIEQKGIIFTNKFVIAK